jgi:PhzF family phenazine biosynthesis protein
VCLIDREQPESWMQGVAAEMNLSETAFILKEKAGTSFQLRWFTPATEVSLCGHATLASAHILWEESKLKSGEQALFHTKSGVLRATKQTDWIEMVFPSRKVEPVDTDPKLSRALGISPKYTGKYVTQNGNLYLVEVESDRQVYELQPNFSLLSETDAEATIVTSRSTDKNYDFISRFFAPAVGIDEDPVTGSAHCYLTPFWAEKLSKNELTGFQSSRRTGVIRCRLSQDKVLLSGRAVTVFRGELLV